MNERIRQLAEQAAELCQTEYESESLRQRRLYNEIFLPKFSELILRECANYAFSDDQERNAMLEHFGVEE